MSFDPKTVALVRRRGEQARATIAARSHTTSKDKIEATVAVSETTGTAFAVGVANGRYGGERGEVTVGARLPADLAAGVALHAIAALVGCGPDPEPHLAALGTGTLAGCGYRYGERLGSSMRRAAAQPRAVPSLAPAQRVGETFTVIEVPRPNGGGKP